MGAHKAKIKGKANKANIKSDTLKINEGNTEASATHMHAHAQTHFAGLSPCKYAHARTHKHAHRNSHSRTHAHIKMIRNCHYQTTTRL